MDEIIQIKCPFDGAVLSVKNQPGIENKNVTCPICKHKYPFTQFKRVGQNQRNGDPGTEYPGYEEDRKTEYPGGKEEKTSYKYEDPITKFKDQPNFTIGKVRLIGTAISYQLRPGRNIIGRKGAQSEANFQIETSGKRRMSREHLVIEVKKMPAKGFVHYVSLFKEKVNETFIGGEPLLYGDCIILNHGDIIKLPDDFSLKFEIPDEEGTEI